MGGGRAWPGFEIDDSEPRVHAWREPRGPRSLAVGLGGGARGRRVLDGMCTAMKSPTGVEGTGGRRQGLAGLRDRRLRAAGSRMEGTARPAWPAEPGRGAGGRRQSLARLRDRRLRAVGSRVAISRAAGPDGTRNTRGATSNKQHRKPGGPPPTGTHSPTTTSTHNNQHPQRNEAATGFRPRPRRAQSVPLSKAAPPAIRRSCPRGPRPRRGQPRGGRRGRGTGSRTRSPGPRCGRSGSTAGRHRARHTRRA